MGDDGEKYVKAAAEGAAKGLGEKIPPIYPDVFKPAAVEIGKTLGTLAGAVNIALMPLSVTIWGYNKISEWLEAEISRKLADVTIEDIIAPKASIVGPAIENIRFLADEPDLRNLFSQLIATSLNRKTAEKAHRGFVEIIKNLSGKEAMILSSYFESGAIPYIKAIYEIHKDEKVSGYQTYFFDSEKCEMDVAQLENLQRLGLLSIGTDFIMPQKVYFEIYKSSYYQEFICTTKPKAKRYNERSSFYSFTQLGLAFCEACISK